ASVAFSQQPGDLDLSFDQDGKVVLMDIDSINPTSSHVGPLMVVTNDLKIIIAFERTVNATRVVQMIRLNTDGSMDETWGTGGEVVAGLGRLRDLEIQPDGKILVLGRSISDPSFIQIQRFQESGLVDTDYGIDGS